MSGIVKYQYDRRTRTLQQTDEESRLRGKVYAFFDSYRPLPSNWAGPKYLAFMCDYPDKHTMIRNFNANDIAFCEKLIGPNGHAFFTIWHVKRGLETPLTRSPNKLDE